MSSCKPKLSLEEKELDILRNAVDIAEKRKGKQTVSDPDVKKIIGILEIAPIDLVRMNEAIWKSDFKGKELSDKELIRAMATHPKLIERPIVIHKNKGVIARPKERILDII